MDFKLTEEQIKTLKLFAYYCKSHGADEVNHNKPIEYCQTEDSWDDNFYSPQTKSPIEGYDKILDTIDDIIKESGIIDKYFEDCENRGEVEVDIDCGERIITLRLSETVYGEEPNGDSLTLDEISENYGEVTKTEVEKLFSMIGPGRTGNITFNGGGDDGYIEGEIVIEDSREDVSNIIEEFTYSWLQSHAAGWEINEGSYGNFIFDPDSQEVVLDFYYNTEDPTFRGSMSSKF